MTPIGFTYSVATIRYAILMVVFGLNSLRECALNFKFFSNVLKDGLPSWTVIQNWVLRFGLYKLLMTLPKRKDWIWIIDHTIEFGTKKCMVILAVSREAFDRNYYKLGHKDMKVAAIDIQEKATGENINRTLELKGLLENSERWELFTQKMRTTKRQAIYTMFMCIAPRKPREKSWR